MKPKRSFVVFGALSVAFGGACVSSLNIPTPPMQSETQAIAASYETPSGTVDINSVQSVLNLVNATLPNLALDWLPNYAEQILANVNDRIEGSGLPDNPDASVETHHFIVSAVVTATRICPGWDNPPGPVASQNGNTMVTAVVENGRLNAEVWGTATGCKQNLTVLDGALTGNATLDGMVILYLLGPLPTSVNNARFLFTFNGQLAVGNQTASPSIDFRVFDGLLGFRVPVSDGEIVVEVGTGSSVTLRASNGTFRCDLTALTCQ
jgi:hypothetical protein